jgi:hypothetical protein
MSKLLKTSARVVAAAGLALSVNAANAVVIDGDEGIGDKVWNDLNRNGIQDPGEPGLSGVTVNLLRPDATFITTNTTDGVGEYYFPLTGTGEGGFNETFLIEFILPAGFEFTVPFAGTDVTIDSNADKLTGRSNPITITDFVNDVTVDAGMFESDPSNGVPAPAGLALLGAGLTALGLRRRRKR